LKKIPHKKPHDRVDRALVAFGRGSGDGDVVCKSLRVKNNRSVFKIVTTFIFKALYQIKQFLVRI
jgi:hypothetical protein